jgi:hypothetical protein
MPSIKRKNLKKIVFLKNKKKVLSSLYTVPAEKKRKQIIIISFIK